VTSALISHVIGCGSLHDPMRKCTYGVLPRLGLVGALADLAAALVVVRRPRKGVLAASDHSRHG